MKRLLFPVVILIVALAIWVLERATGAQLRAEIAGLRDQDRRRAELVSKRHRLEALQVSDDELAGLRRHAVAEVQSGDVSNSQSPAPASMASIGEWTSAKTWSNRGQASAPATLETALFAAAGGDTALFGSLLEFDDDVRSKLDQVRSRLPSDQRARYPSAEALVSALATKSIPVGEAQLVWYHESDPDHATAGLFMRNPPTALGAADLAPEVSKPAANDAAPPPALTADASSKPVVLSLRRQGDQWRLVVPPNAVERILAQLGERTP